MGPACASNVRTTHPSPLRDSRLASHSLHSPSAPPVTTACSSRSDQSTVCRSSACALSILCAGAVPARPSQKMTLRSHATLHSRAA